MSVPRESALGRLNLTHEEAVLVSFLLSREIVEHRGSQYEGVAMYVQECRDVRNKIKRVLTRYQDAVQAHVVVEVEVK